MKSRDLKTLKISFLPTFGCLYGGPFHIHSGIGIIANVLFSHLYSSLWSRTGRYYCSNIIVYEHTICVDILTPEKSNSERSVRNEFKNCFFFLQYVFFTPSLNMWPHK